MSDLFIAFYSPSGERRDIDPDKITDSVTWEYLEQGGMGQCTIPLAYGFDAHAMGVEGGDVVKIWVGSEVQPRYIGQVTVDTRTLNLAETYSIIAFGEMEAMNRILISCSLVRPGGVDIAEFAEYLLRHYAARKEKTYAYEFALTGVTLETLNLDGATIREAFDQLTSQAPGVAVWGWEVNASGDVQCYLRPRVSEVEWVIPAGETVRLLTKERDFAQIVNRLQPLRGGSARFPNLLGAVIKDSSGNPNTGFEHPETISESGGNLLRDGSFELKVFSSLTLWTLSGGADDKREAARIGLRGIELDAVGEKVAQTQNTSVIAPVPGNPYEMGIWARRETGTDATTVVYTLKWRNAGGSQVGSTETLTIVPPSVVYEYYRKQLLCPSGATGYTVEVECTVDGGDGVYLDDIRLFDQSAVQQPGWGFLARGTAVINEADYAYEEDSHQGCVSVLLDVTSFDLDENDVAIRPFNNSRVPVTGGQSLRFGVWVKSAPGATGFPKTHLRVAPKTASGSDAGGVIDVIKVFAAVGAPLEEWTLYEHTYTVPQFTVDIEFALILRGSGRVLIDAAFVRDAFPDSGEFIEGDVWEREVSAVEICPVGSSAYLSESLYGRQEGRVTNDSLREWNAEAQRWVENWFELHSVIGGVQSLEVANDERFVTPGTGRQLRIVGLPEVLADKWPVQVTYVWSGTLEYSVELDDPEPSLARLLVGSNNQAQVSGGSASSGGTGSSGITEPPAQVVRVQEDGGSIYTRGKLNLIPGSNITLSISDDETNDRIDVEIIGTIGGSLIAIEDDDASQGDASILNFGDSLAATVITGEATIHVVPIPVTTLTDAATIVVDASPNRDMVCRVVLGGNRTLGNPSSPHAGQKIIFLIQQDATGSRTLTLDTDYQVGTDITGITLSTAANVVDYLGCIYDAVRSKWDVIAFRKGYL